MARNLTEANFSRRGSRSVWPCQFLSGLSIIFAGRSRTFHWIAWSLGHDRREPSICLSDDARISGCRGHPVSKGRTGFPTGGNKGLRTSSPAYAMGCGNTGRELYKDDLLTHIAGRSFSQWLRLEL